MEDSKLIYIIFTFFTIFQDFSNRGKLEEIREN